MSNASTQNRPVAGSIETALEVPLPYAVQALLRAVDAGLNMPEPEFDPVDEDAYLIATARRMDTMRELLAVVIHAPSMQNAARSADEMGRWLTDQAPTYRPLTHDDDVVETAAPKELESSPA